MEKLIENRNLSIMLHEDIEWAVELISKNKLYAVGMDNIKYNKDRPEISAWLN